MQTSAISKSAFPHHQTVALRQDKSSILILTHWIDFDVAVSNAVGNCNSQAWDVTGSKYDVVLPLDIFERNVEVSQLL